MLFSEMNSIAKYWFYCSLTIAANFTTFLLITLIFTKIFFDEHF